MFLVGSAFKSVRPIVPRAIDKLSYASDSKPSPASTVTLTSTVEPASKTSGTPPRADKGPIDYIVKLPEVLVKVEPVTHSEVVRKSLSFDDVPGPNILRHLARFWHFIPVVGTQVTASAIQYLLSAGKIFGSRLSWSSNSRLFRWLLDEYGPIVRLQGPFGGDVVILSRPEHAGTVFQNEGKYPVRSNLDCVEKYRLQHRKYKQSGPFLMYGPEWEKLRKTIEQPLNQSAVRRFDEIEKTCDEFITRIQRIRNRQEEVPATFRDEIYKWAMECTCSVMLNKRLGFLDPVGLSSTSEPARLLESLYEATKAIQKCESGLHLWKFFETPAWRALVRNCCEIDSIVNKYVHKAQDQLRQRKASETVMVATDKISFLEGLLLTKGMEPEDALTVLLDVMLIGVNAISHSVAFLLYHLARNPRAQRRLYEEIKAIPAPITKETLSNIPFLQACIKESLRLKPPMPVLSRILSTDVVIHNYFIPKGTYVLIATHLASLKEEHFEDAQRFKPERWLDADLFADTNALATIPFGHGPKACVARELAETEIALVIAKVLLKYRIEYHYGDINSTNRLLAQADRPLRFRFVDRM